MITSVMVARDQNGAIGKDNNLPWHLSDDLKLFKRNTVDHTVLMGRKTYESIGKPLPKRNNIILTHNLEYDAPGCQTVHSIEEAYDFCKDKGVEQLFIIGGGSVFKSFLPLAQLLYISEVHTSIEDADVFFPEVDLSKYIHIFTQPFKQSEHNDFDFTFNLYHKR